MLSRRLLSLVSRRSFSSQAPDYVAAASRLDKRNNNHTMGDLRVALEEMRAENKAAMQADKNFDFEFFKKNISSPEIVALCEKKFNELKPTPPAKPEIETLDFPTLLAEAKTFKQEAQKKVDEETKYLTKLKANRITADTTVEEVNAMYPERAKQIEEEIEAGDIFSDTPVDN